MQGVLSCRLLHLTLHDGGMHVADSQTLARKFLTDYSEQVETAVRLGVKPQLGTQPE